jgi:cytochrome c oxidase cbb3-type subunit 2
MTSVVFTACLLVAAPAGAPTGSSPAAERTDWDLRWMVSAPVVAPKRPPRETPKLRELGQSLYQRRCAGCHGDRGDGNGPHAARLTVSPTNFTAGTYKLRSTPTGSIPTDTDLFTTLTRGVHGTPMLPWTSLSEEERWALVYRLKSFSVRFREERPAAPIRVPAPPKEDAGLRAQGASLYGKLMCARCHGEEGAGNGAAARAYERGTDRAVRVRDFTRGRFIRGAEMEDIFVTLRAGIEGTPMAAYDTLRDEEVWAIAAYVRSLIRERPLHELPPARTHAGAVPAMPAKGRDTP